MHAAYASLISDIHESKTSHVRFIGPLKKDEIVRPYIEINYNPYVYRCSTCGNDYKDPSYNPQHCDKCNKLQLKYKISQLEETIRFLTTEQNEKLRVCYTDELVINKWIRQYAVKLDEPSPREDPITDLSNMYFITYTFDPAKFGSNNDNDLERNYILSILAQIIKLEKCTYIYGCFENHQSMVTHSHFIIRTNYIAEIKKHLKKSATDNPYNKAAIDIGPAKEKASIEYINKRKEKHITYDIKHFFQFFGFNAQDYARAKPSNPASQGTRSE